MGVSYFRGNTDSSMKYFLNKYNIHKFDEDNFLISLDYGPWILLNRNEFDMLRRNRVSEDINLFKSLESRGIIITEGNFKGAVSECQGKLSHLSTGVDLGIITPTLRCNLKCIYCHAKSKELCEKGYDMDQETAKDAVDFLFQTPSKILTIEFQGGEPLVNFDIIKYVVEYAKKKNGSDNPDSFGCYCGEKKLSFIMVSNMTLMDKDIADFMIRNKVRICTSLDGPKELHNKNRPYIGGGGTYEDVVKWMDYFSKDKKYKISMLPTITRYSFQYPEQMIDEYISRGSNNMRARPLNIAGQAIDNWKQIGYEPDEFIIFWKEYLEKIIEKNRNGVVFLEEDVKFFLMKILGSNRFRHACLNKPCGIGTVQCAINHSGDIYTCDEARSNDMFKLGNIKENNYKSIFTSKNVAEMIGLSSCVATLCDSCAWNAYCAPCLVSTYGAQNNLIPKMPQDYLCKIKGEQVKTIFEKLLFSKDRDIILNFVNSRRSSSSVMPNQNFQKR